MAEQEKAPAGVDGEGPGHDCSEGTRARVSGHCTAERGAGDPSSTRGALARHFPTHAHSLDRKNVDGPPPDPLPDGSVGLYPVAPGDDRARVGVLDFDAHRGEAWAQVTEAARPVLEHLRQLGHRPMPFSSQSGTGLHLWLAWDEPQPAAAIRALLTEALEACGLEPGDGGVGAGQAEVFPKQDAVPEDGCGSCIDLPLAGQSRPLDRDALEPADAAPLPRTSRPLPDGLPPEEPESQRAAREAGTDWWPWDEGKIRSALDAIPADDYGDWIKVLRALKGGAKRKQKPDAEARALAEAWSKKSDKHDEREFDRKWTRGFRRDARGKGRGLGSLFWLAKEKYGWQSPDDAGAGVIAKIRIQDSDPKVYMVTLARYEDRGEVLMGFSDLRSTARFQDKVGNAIDQLVPPPKPTELNRLLAEAEHVPADEDASPFGQFKQRLALFLDETSCDDRAELRLEHRSWRDGKGGTWFKWRDMESWLRRHRYFDLDHATALSFVRRAGGDTGVVNMGDYGTQRAWWVPMDPRGEALVQPEPEATEIAGDKLEHAEILDARRKKNLRRHHAQKRERGE